MIPIECETCGQHFEVTNEAYKQRLRRQSFSCRDCYQSGAKGYDNDRLWQFIVNDLGLYGASGRLTAI